VFNRRTLLQLSAAIPALIASSAQAVRRAPSAQPNFIHICADDMRFDDIYYMTQLRKLIRGATVFGNHFVPFPGCAPSQASILTGQHVHNHGVLGNHRPYGYWRFHEIEDNTLAVWLANAGYTVSHVGKFINGYKRFGGSGIPPGYSDWHAFSAGGNYYDFTLNDNGQDVAYNSGEYSTDIFVQKALDFIATAPQPYTIFLWVACPHEPSTPASRDLGTFDNIDMPIGDSFNEADMSDKPRLMQRLPFLTNDQIAAIQTDWRRRQETLQSLDRGIATIVDALTRNGQLDNTHILFTSDNGYLQGEHRVDDRKNLCYDEAAKVPLCWRQPGGTETFILAPVLNMDVTTAMLELAGATAGYPLDGRSLVPLLSGDVDGWNTAVLTQCTTASAVVTRHYRYVEWFNEKGIELYDMIHDRAQMQNVAGKPEYAQIQASLAEALHALQGCAGSNCSWTGKFKFPPGQ
jgi:arylsulfatase A-like enzyme